MVNARVAQKRQLASANRAINKAARTARNQSARRLTLYRSSWRCTLRPSDRACGSAYKRLAMIEHVLGRPVTKAIRSMQLHCALAEDLARAVNLSDLFYPVLNRMAAELVLTATRPQWKGFDSASVAAVRQSLETKARDDPIFGVPWA